MANLYAQSMGQVGPWSFLTGNHVNFSMDESADQMEWIFQAFEAATITRLGFRYGARTGTPPSYKISLQGVDGTGRADGTIKGGASPASKVFTPPADATWNGTWQWVTLDNSFVVARGDFLSMVIKYDSGTINGSNFSSFTTANSALRDDGGAPYNVTFNNTGAVTTRTAGYPIWGFGSAGTAYGAPAQTYGPVAINSGTTPDEVALAFTLPAGMGTSLAVVGARLGCGTYNAATTLKVILYSGTTVLQDVTIDTDVTVANTRPQHEFYFDEATLSTLSVGTKYYLSVQPQAATSINIETMDVAAAADLDAWPMGQAFNYASRTDAGAWTDLTTRRPFIVPLIADITAAGGVARLISPGALVG